MKINQRDLRQYSSIAYSLRAILAVQQESLFDIDPLPLLDKDAVEQLKAISDMATLGVLGIADDEARLKNKYEIAAEEFNTAIPIVIHNSLQGQTIFKPVETITLKPYSLLRKSIEQKLASYQKYNNISQAVFKRNIQVYFAKVPWPKSQEASNELVSLFQSACVQYGTELLYFAERLAKMDSSYTIAIDHMNRALHAFLPYDVNEFEDVTYFPLLNGEEQVLIESYDLDAFRDSGLHWKIIEFIIDAPNFNGLLEPDPFASELLVEGIAQFGVLLWRMSGNETLANNDPAVSVSHFMNGMQKIRALTEKNNSRFGRDRESIESIVSNNEEDSLATIRQFVDITEKVGIDFEHRSSDWLSRLLRSFVFKEDENLARMAIPPAFGGSGIAAEDINNDGFDDVLILSGSGNKLYLNNQGQNFIDISNRAGINYYREDLTLGEPRQPIISDFNGDGHPDIFISYVNDNHRLLKGDGQGNFEDVSHLADLGGAGHVAGPCTALDFDNDGDLDLYIGYFGNYLKGELPTLSRYNTNGGPNQLFRNDGDFTFVNVTLHSGVDDSGWTQAVGHTDINNDGWQDLISGNDFGNNAYLINQGNGTFINKSGEYGTDKPSYTMNVGITDLNRDNSPDFYISNIVVMEKDDKYVLPNEETPMHFNPNSLSTMRVLEANDLFISQKSKSDLRFENSENIDRAKTGTGWSWDADFFDYDNDGDDDLYCLNGMNPYSVYGEDNAYYSSPEGSDVSAIFASSKKERNVFFINQGGRLEDGSELSGLDLLHTSRSGTFLDYDNDGDLDVIINNYHGKAFVYENQEGSSRNWVKIKLINEEPGANREAVGARIILDTKGNNGMWREVHTTDGYLSVHPKKVHFGLGNATSAKGKIIWPDGKIHKFNLENINTSFKALRKNGKLILTEYLVP